MRKPTLRQLSVRLRRHQLSTGLYTDCQPPQEPLEKAVQRKRWAEKGRLRGLGIYSRRKDMYPCKLLVSCKMDPWAAGIFRFKKRPGNEKRHRKSLGRCPAACLCQDCGFQGHGGQRLPRRRRAEWPPGTLTPSLTSAGLGGALLHLLSQKVAPNLIHRTSCFISRLVRDSTCKLIIAT